MTVPYRMPLTAAREARRLHLHNPQTYTVAMLARRFGVSIACLRESMDAAGQRARRKVMSDEGPGDEAPSALAIEREIRRRMVALERQDTRDFTGRYLGDPPPGRSALDQRREGV
jgi:hypothetical protein